MTVVPPGSNPHNLHHPHNKKKKTPQRLLVPSVYRYSCQGVFSVSTDTPGSVGKCRGLRSHLEHLLDMDAVAHRSDAIRNFLAQGEDFGVDGGGGDVADNSADAAQKMMEDRYVHQALVYPKPPPKKQPQGQAQKSSSPTNNTTKKQQPNGPILPNATKPSDATVPPGVVETPDATTRDTNQPQSNYEYKDIDDIMDDNDYHPFSQKVIRESWSAYGSTEVECLQLTDPATGETEIAAVAPYNHALVSLRKVELQRNSTNNNGHQQQQEDEPVDMDSITCLQVGFSRKLVLLLENTHTTENEQEQEQQQQQQQNIDTENGKKGDEKTLGELHNAVSEIPGAPLESTYHNMQNRLERWQERLERWAGRSQTVLDFTQKMVDLQKRIVVKSYTTATMLADPEFQRTTQAHIQRNVNNMPNAMAFCANVVKNILGFGGGGGDDNDNDNPNDKDGRN